MGCKSSKEPRVYTIDLGAGTSHQNRSDGPSELPTKPASTRPVEDFFCAKCGHERRGVRKEYKHRCSKTNLPLYYEANRVSKCEQCIHNVNDCCQLTRDLDRGREGNIYVGARLPFAACPIGEWEEQGGHCEACKRYVHRRGPIDRCPYCDSSQTVRIQNNAAPHIPDNLADVRLATFHFNPLRFKRLRDTYFEWLPSLGELSESLVCYEVVFDDDEPEIPDSIVIRADRSRHFLWQKEALANRALKDATQNGFKYFGWLDHDLIFKNPRWLTDGLAMLDAGYPAVQLFDEVRFLNQDRHLIRSRRSAMEAWTADKSRHGSPGGAWLTTVDFLNSVNGLMPYCIVGGGDQAFFAAMTQDRLDYLHLFPSEMAAIHDFWINRVRRKRDIEAAYVPGPVYHLWHGDRENRQYTDRFKILRDWEFDPLSDIETESTGLLSLKEGKRGLVDAMRGYFEKRKDDGDQ